MSSSVTTLERSFGMAAGIGRPSTPVETPVTNQALRQLQFRMGGKLVLIELKEVEPDWLVEWIERLSTLLSLPDNWDSYGGHSIRLNAIEGAIRFLLSTVQDFSSPPPAAFAHRSGGVQLEWHVGETDLEVLALSDGQFRISFSRNGEEVIPDQLTNLHTAIVAFREFLRSS